MCSVDTCDVKATRREMCELHYRRFMRTGDPLMVRRRSPDTYPARQQCSVDECIRLAVTHGHCRMHWERTLRNGAPVLQSTDRAICGSQSGYDRHMRNGEQACDLCRFSIRRRGWGKSGMDPDAAEAAWLRADGTCELCGRSDRPLVVDHDHATGRVRGAVCRRCNNAMALVDEIGISRLERYEQGDEDGSETI